NNIQQKYGTGEMAPCTSILATLEEDLSSILNTHIWQVTMTCKSSSRDSDVYFWLLQAPHVHGEHKTISLVHKDKVQSSGLFQHQKRHRQGAGYINGADRADKQECTSRSIQKSSFTIPDVISNYRLSGTEWGWRTFAFDVPSAVHCPFPEKVFSDHIAYISSKA
ncbi:hypothetical protein STEG23_027042, partial [Scotinomys teguina]